MQIWCKELIDKGSCDKGFIWNPSNCECECDKLYDIREYLDYENCKCRKKLVYKLVEECTENVDGKEIYPAKLHSEETITPVCISRIIYIILFSLFFTISIGIANDKKVDKKNYKHIDVYYIGYITIKKVGDYENIHSVNILYLIIYSARGYFTEKKYNKYLILDSTNKYEENWSGIRPEIKRINRGKELFYEKDYSKIKVDTDDDLPLKKTLKFPTLTIIIRAVFLEGKKLYRQIYFDECLCELWKYWFMKELMIQKELIKNCSRFRGKLVKMIKGFVGKFDDFSISPKIRQILFHQDFELKKEDLL